MKQASRRKHHYIYKITRTDGSWKYYIGMHSTDDLDDGYFGSGSLLSKSIKKHGKEKHVKEILEHLPTREALKLRETELVNEELLGDKRCMNLKLGGEGGWDHIKIDPVVLKERASRGGKLGGLKTWRNAQSYITTEVRSKALKTRKLRGKQLSTAGLKFTDETRKKMSKSASGEKSSQFGTCWIHRKTDVKKVKKSDLQKFLSQGFSIGRKSTI